MKQPELNERVIRLEKKVSTLYDLVLTIKNSVDEILEIGKQRKLSSRTTDSIRRERISQLIGLKDQRLPNPWAIDTAIYLLDSRVGRQIIKDSYQTYRPTIETLKSKGDWLSADEVGRITKRKRNTESAYLNRLWRAGLVERKKHGNKVKYMLKNEKTLKKVFGI